MQVYEIYTLSGIDYTIDALFLTRELAIHFLEQDGFKLGKNELWDRAELDDDGTVWATTSAQIQPRNVVTASQQGAATDQNSAVNSG